MSFGEPMIFRALFTVLRPRSVCLSAAPVPGDDAVCQQALCARAVGGQQPPVQIVLPADSGNVAYEPS